MVTFTLNKIPLRFFPEDWRAALRDVALVIAGLTFACLIIDTVIFRSVLPISYINSYTSPPWPRTLLTCLQAAKEELIYRLSLTTALVALVMVIRKPGIAPLRGSRL